MNCSDFLKLDYKQVKCPFVFITINYVPMADFFALE